jgi:uncharacterized membrane protein HdeD (DUF308 family)
MAKKPEKQTTKKEPEKAVKEPVVKKKIVKTVVKDSTEKLSKETKTVKRKNNADRGVLLLGFGLLFFGTLLLAGRFLNIAFGDYMWPFIFITPGVLVFVTALSSDDRHGEGLSILGSILTALGLVFLFQSISGLWASWAYAWALVAPTSIGVGQVIYGANKQRESIQESGRRLINIGLVMLGIGFVFFELILGISGFGLARFGIPVFPMMLIFAGGVILVRSIVRNR